MAVTNYSLLPMGLVRNVMEPGYVPLVAVQASIRHDIHKGFHSQAVAQHSVQPTSGTLRVFRAFFWLWVFSGSPAASRPAPAPVTHTVRRSRTLTEDCNVRFG